MVEGQKVNPQDYDQCLKELMNICMLCNDSGLAYNEVCVCATTCRMQGYWDCALKRGCGDQLIREGVWSWGLERGVGCPSADQ